jgi:protein arginine kinase activator
MVCQQCQKNIANIQIVQKINGRQLEIYLCQQCASKNEKIFFKMPIETDKTFHINLNDLLPGLLNIESMSKNPVKEKQCDLCDMNFDHFQKTGKLGCGKCYEVFTNELSPIISRIHGNAQYKGKIPGQKLENCKELDEIGMLKKELKSAIADERYEEAAKIRDKIKGLEYNDKDSDKEGSI